MATNGNRWHSNTTLVKVKFIPCAEKVSAWADSNTTLVKVKCKEREKAVMQDPKFKYNTC